MGSRYDKRNRKSSYKQEYWYVTNIDHTSIKIEMIRGRILPTIVHDKTDHSFILPDTTTSIAKNKREVDKKVTFYLDKFFRFDEFTFMQAHTDEENYSDYMNLYTDLIWVKNKLGLKIWDRNNIKVQY